MNVAPCENISYGACRDGGCNRGAGAPGEAELAFYCGTCGGALNVNARGSNIRFYPSERSVSSAAVDVYAVVAVVDVLLMLLDGIMKEIIRVKAT